MQLSRRATARIMAAGLSGTVLLGLAPAAVHATPVQVGSRSAEVSSARPNVEPAPPAGSSAQEADVLDLARAGRADRQRRADLRGLEVTRRSGTFIDPAAWLGWR